MKIIKALIHGLLLAACFAGWYYWSLSLKPDGGRDATFDRLRFPSGGVELRDAVEAGVETLGTVVSKAEDLVGESRVEALESVTKPETVAEATTVESDSSLLKVAMRNNLDALRNLGR